MSVSGSPTDPLTRTRNVRGLQPNPLAGMQAVDEATQNVPLAEAVAHCPEMPGYEILGILGRGGMGVVYKARQKALNRVVALKMLLHGVHADAAEVARFNFEAEALARLHHPNIVEVYEVGWQRGQPFMALEFVEGGSLGDRLNDRPLPPRQAATIVLSLARALELIHRQGLIHRDIKPSNIFVQSGPPVVFKLGDFGLARIVGEKPLLTRTGFVVGTPEYMAPEQLLDPSDQVGPGADIYALGVVFYQLLAGRRPFESAASLEVLEQVRSREPDRPARFNARVPRDLDVITLKCLEKAPSRRYITAGELADDLERFLDWRPIHARAVGAFERGWKWAKRRPAVASLLACLFLVILIGGVGILTQWQRAEQRADAERRAKEEAVFLRKEADDQKLAAEKATEGATAARAKAELAEKSERQARQSAEAVLYSSQILLALREYESGHVPSARLRLEPYRPKPAERREFEWHYLDRVCRSEKAAIQVTNVWPYQLAFTPDGQSFVLAAGGSPGTPPEVAGFLFRWDANGMRQPLLAADIPTPTSIVFSPDGKRSVSIGVHNMALVHEVASGRLLIGLPCHIHGIRPAVFFAGNGNALVMNGTSEMFKIQGAPAEFAQPGVWKVSLTGGRPQPLAGAALLGVTRDGQKAAALDGKGGILILDLANGQTLQQFAVTGHPHAFSPDGRYVATTLPGSEQGIWNVATGKREFSLHPPDDYINHSTFSDDGTLLALAASDGIVRVYEVKNAALKRQYRGHDSGLRAVAFNPQGTLLVSADHQGAVKLWDLTRPQGGARLSSGQMGEHFAALAFSADSRSLLLSENNPALSAFDVNKLERIFRKDLPNKHGTAGSGVSEQAFSRNGRILATASKDNPAQVRLWDLTGYAEGKAPRELPHVIRGSGLPNPRLALSGNGKVLVTAFCDFNGHAECLVWDATDGRFLTALPLPALFNLALSDDGRYLAAVGWGRKLHFWDLQAGKPLPAPEGEFHGIFALAFAPNSSRLAWGELRKTQIRIWDIAEGRDVLAAPLRGPAWLAGLAFSHSGNRLAAIGWDSIVHLWDAHTGHELLILRDNCRPRIDNYQYTARVAFSPDDTRLASLHWDGAITVYDTLSPAPITQLVPPNQP